MEILISKLKMKNDNVKFKMIERAKQKQMSGFVTATKALKHKEIFRMG